MKTFIMLFLLGKKTNIKNRYTGKIILLDRISFHVDIETEGDLVENWNTKETLDTQFLERIETNTENEVKKIVGNVLKKIQHEYKADVAGFGESLRLEHPNLWKKVKNNWGDTFSKVAITYSVNATITHYGTVKTQ
nr:Ger(x)C family spore germination C-terminal domain-containing protein [Bacillus spizizenii]